MSITQAGKRQVGITEMARPWVSSPLCPCRAAARQGHNGPVHPNKQPSAEAANRLRCSSRAAKRAFARLPSVRRATCELRPSICTSQRVDRSIEPFKRPSSRPRVEGTSSMPQSGERPSRILPTCGRRASRAPVQQPIKSVKLLSR